MMDNEQNNYGATDGPAPALNQEDLEWKNAEVDINDIMSPKEMMRLGFIRKVLGIVSAQLIITFFFVLCSCTSKSFSTFQINHIEVLIISFVTLIISCIVLFCCRGISKKVPHNYILLSIFTISEGYLVSSSCIPFSGKTVLLAMFLTAVICTGLFIYAMTTKSDFTTMGGILFVCLLGLTLFGILLIFIRSRVSEIIYCIIGVVLFGIYLIYDLQLLTGDKERSIDMDDYILGSISIYLDVINIFTYILRLLGNSQN